jgi:hypothetical protein
VATLKKMRREAEKSAHKYVKAWRKKERSKRIAPALSQTAAVPPDG